MTLICEVLSRYSLDDIYWNPYNSTWSTVGVQLVPLAHSRCLAVWLVSVCSDVGLLSETQRLSVDGLRLFSCWALRMPGAALTCIDRLSLWQKWSGSLEFLFSLLSDQGRGRLVQLLGSGSACAARAWSKLKSLVRQELRDAPTPSFVWSGSWRSRTQRD